MAEKAYRVTAALVSAYSTDGRCLYFYRGSDLPPEGGLREGEQDRLVEAGLVEELEIPDPPDDEDAPARSRSRRKSAADKGDAEDSGE